MNEVPIELDRPELALLTKDPVRLWLPFLVLHDFLERLRGIELPVTNPRPLHFKGVTNGRTTYLRAIRMHEWREVTRIGRTFPSASISQMQTPRSGSIGLAVQLPDVHS